MLTFRKILAPVDMSDHSRLGIRYAVELAGPEAEVIVFNVITVEETPFPQGAEEWVATQTELPKLKKTLERRKKELERFVTEEFPQTKDQRLRLDLEIGTPYRKIVEKAERENVDMIIMCTHGRTGVLHMLIGSVTERVVRRSPCPVLSVPPPRRHRPQDNT